MSVWKPSQASKNNLPLLAYIAIFFAFSLCLLGLTIILPFLTPIRLYSFLKMSSFHLPDPSPPQNNSNSINNKYSILPNQTHCRYRLADVYKKRAYREHKSCYFEDFPNSIASTCLAFSFLFVCSQLKIPLFFCEKKKTNGKSRIFFTFYFLMFSKVENETYIYMRRTMKGIWIF